MNDAHSIAGISRLAGEFAWAEDEVCSILAGWIPSIAESDVAAFVGARCHQHAWHADLWRDRIASVPGIDPLVLIAPADDVTRTLFSDVATTESSIERLEGVYRVLLPRMVSAYRELMSPENRILDAPTVRIATLVLHEEETDILAAEDLLRRL